MNLRSNCLTVAAVVVSQTIAPQASGQHFDIFLARPAAGNQTVVGGADVDTLAYDDVARVFEVELGTLGGEYLAVEPGVNHPDINNAGLTAYPSSAAALQPGDVLRLREREFSVAGLENDLFYWNGMGSVAFTPAMASFRIDGGDPLGSTAGAGGVFDDHPFLVVDSDSLAGIYLASVFGTVNELQPSDPIYLVMGTEDLITAEFLGISQGEFEMLSDEEIDAALEDVIEQAVAYVEANIVVPEAASLGLAAIACWAMAAMRGARRPYCVLH